MFRRISLAGIALVATMVAYWAYDFALVPLLTPTPVAHQSTDIGEESWKNGRAPLLRYQKLLSHYFPADHWSLTGTPKIIENGQVMLVLHDYKPDDRGGVELSSCAIIGFPTPRVPGSTPPNDAIIVEAPAGAKLQFDENFRPTRGQIGRLVAGYFPGQLVIRSQMNKPTPDDDLYVSTRDLRLKETLIFTDSPCEFRLGPHSGSGRQLEIRLLREEQLSPGQSGLAIAGIVSLEIRTEVQASIALPEEMASFDGNLLGSPQQDRVAVRNIPGRGPVQLTSADDKARQIDIRSDGPFRFDFTRFVASFQENVQAVMQRAEGPSDTLIGRELLFHFADKQGAPLELNPADEPELAKRQGEVLGNLAPYLVEAVGNPVRLDSPATQSAVRGRKIQAWIGDRRLRISGSPATIANGMNEAQAGWIDYQAPPEDALSPIGNMTMSGPGWLRITPQEDQPERVIETRWKRVDGSAPAVVLNRDHAGQPILTVNGRPTVASSNLGRMEADSLRIQFREVAPDGEGPAVELRKADINGEGLAVIPERVDANGAVDFRGRELIGRTNSLVAWFRPMDQRLGSNQLADAPNQLTSSNTTTAAIPRQQNSIVSNQQYNSKSKRQYVLSAEHLQLDVGLFGRRAEPTGLLCSGSVLFEEKPTTSTMETPLRVAGQQLRVDGLHEEGIRLTVAGTADGQQASTNSTGIDRPGLAQITGKGIRLWAKQLHADQLRNRMWIDGPGDARFDLSQSRKPKGLTSLQGEATVRWTGGLQFNGKEIELRGEVFAETAEGWLRCDRLAARLSQPINLNSGSSENSGEVDIAEVECFGGVTIDHRSTDTVGQRSHERAKLKTLKINQSTGEISGHGPGWVRSVHLGNQGFSQFSGQQPSMPQAPTSDAKLSYLRLNFQRGISGNIHSRSLRFHERIRGVYGPVLAWDQELPLNSPQALPRDVVLIECDELRVHEDPGARFSAPRQQNGTRSLGPVELQALGNVRLEGSSGEEKVTKFTAEATSASYTQLKELFVLQGNAQRGVSIWVQNDPNRPPARSVAGKITYDLRQGKVTKVEDIRSVDYRTAQPLGQPFNRPTR